MTVLDFLPDKVFYADMIDCITRGTATVLAASSAGVLLSSLDDVCMMSAADDDAVMDMLDLLASRHMECKNIVAHQKFAVPIIEARLGFSESLECLSSAYFGSALPTPDRPDLHIETLTSAWTDVVATHYHLDGIDYVRDRLDSRVVIGAFLDKTLVGFIGQHETGGMGMLVVFPQFRRQGIAEYLLTHLTNNLLSQGCTPYDHIVTGNLASEALQRKLGFTISTQTLYWMSPSDEQLPCGDGIEQEHFWDSIAQITPDNAYRAEFAEWDAA